ncbi:MAG: hypothetical protein ABJF50_13065 [Paracoccaceae bacterium]
MNMPAPLRSTYKRIMRRPLEEDEVTVQTATERIKDIHDLMAHLSAAQKLRGKGDEVKVNKAKRIERLCRLHPRFGDAATDMIVVNVLV